MNFDELSNQHLHWKSLVESLFDENNSSILNPSTIIKDNDCDLGKWIYSNEASRYSSSQSFKKLQEVHQNFHLYAGKIILDFQSGNIEDANRLHPLFTQASDDIASLLQDLKKEES